MKLYIKSSIYSEKDGKFGTNNNYGVLRYENADDAVESEIMQKIRWGLSSSKDSGSDADNFNIENLHLDPSSDCTLNEFFKKSSGTYHIQYDFDLSCGDSNYSLPFHMNFDGDAGDSGAYGVLICDVEEYSDDTYEALHELVDRANGIDRDKFAGYRNTLVDRDIYDFMKNLVEVSSDYTNVISSEISDMNWTDGYSMVTDYNSDDDHIAVCYVLRCDKNLGEKYVKSGKFEYDYSSLTIAGECFQDHDGEYYFSEIDTYVYFPRDPDDSVKQQILSCDERDIYDSVIDHNIDLINKKTAIYEKSKTKKKISQEELLNTAVDVWDILGDEDEDHALSQEELIDEVIKRLESRAYFDQKLTNNQKQIIKRELKTYGEFIYKGPNGLHYDTEQGWL